MSQRTPSLGSQAHVLRLRRLGQPSEQCSRLTSLADGHESLGANQRCRRRRRAAPARAFPASAATSALAASGVPISPKALAAAAADSGFLAQVRRGLGVLAASCRAATELITPILVRPSAWPSAVAEGLFGLRSRMRSSASGHGPTAPRQGPGASPRTRTPRIREGQPAADERAGHGGSSEPPGYETSHFSSAARAVASP